MRLMILGASLAQLAGIRKAMGMGHEVVTCDNREDSVGHRLSGRHAFASTFDVEAVTRQAISWQVDGIFTMGTDQPVLTAALASSSMGLPSLLDVQTARAVTDKRVMKRLFVQLEVPAAPWRLVHRNAMGDVSLAREALSGLAAPYVTKPVDSQGQRGVLLLHDAASVMDRMEEVLSHSRADEILVESHYPNEEVTVSGWVVDGQTVVLSITDRMTFSEQVHIGICLSHEMPSRHFQMHGALLIELTERIVSGFGIRNGPIYFQFLIGAEGVMVNEVACRIGGAFEADFLPWATGFDITEAQIRRCLGQPVASSQLQALKAFDIGRQKRCLSVQLFFAHPCTIAALTPLEDVLSLEGVLDAGYHVPAGHVVRGTRDATARIGYCIVTGDSPAQVEERLTRLYGVLKVIDMNGRNMIFHREVRG